MEPNPFQASIAKSFQQQAYNSRIPKASSDAPPLTKVLSQYEMLMSVTMHLSSVDIARLAASCKDHKAYITGDSQIHDKIRAAAVCDGKGIETRAMCFHHFNGDVKNATVACRGGDCKPCESCTAMVCNECRFHVKYFDSCTDKEFKKQENFYAYATERVLFSDTWGGEHNPALDFPGLDIESVRAIEVFHLRKRRFCGECGPKVFKTPYVGDILETIEQKSKEKNARVWCKCTLGNSFVKGHWLCLPCFFAMEKQAYSRRPVRQVYGWRARVGPVAPRARVRMGRVAPQARVRRGRVWTHLTAEYLCDEEKGVGDLQYLVLCRDCKRYIRPRNLTQLLADADAAAEDEEWETEDEA